jgi:sphinganine-1-phosphate aldolase
VIVSQDLMKQKGWNLSALQYPSSIHLCCTMLHTQDGVADRFVRDVRESAETIMANPEAHKGGSCAIYGNFFAGNAAAAVLSQAFFVPGMAQSIPDRDIVGTMAWTYLDALYATKGSKKAVAK